MSILAALLSFLGSLVSAVPKTLEVIRDWKRRDAINKDRATKDARNRQAIENARRNPPV